MIRGSHGLIGYSSRRILADPSSRMPLSNVSNVRMVSEDKNYHSTRSNYTRSRSVERFSHKECSFGDPKNPLDVTQYQHIIWRSLCQNELNERPVVFRQEELNSTDRGIAFDNMSHVHYRLGLGTNGLYIAYGMMDRYMSIKQLPKNKLKTYCCAALFIGSKVEDYHQPRIGDLIRMADHCFGENERSFSPRDLYAAEIDLINTIGFEITFGTPLFYITQLLRISGQTQDTVLLGRYILEVMQTGEKFIGMKYSKQAAVAVMVTRILNGETKWTSQLAGYTNYSETELYTYALAVRDMLAENDLITTRFMRRKYGTDLFHCVSRVRIPMSFK